MGIARVGSAAGAVAIAVMAGGLAAAAQAAADTTTLGQQGRLVSGEVIQDWTVSALKPSTDTVPVTVHGTLWEAAATDTAVAGTVQPVISNLNARAADGTNYRVLFLAATPAGVNPSRLQEGQSVSGKLYFDVTGSAPDHVVYNDGAQDLLTWVTPPPAPVAAEGVTTTPAQRSAPPASGTGAAAAGANAQGSTSVPVGVPPQPAAAGTLPAEGGAVSAGTPLAGPATGSSGTPIAAEPGATAPSQGTPAAGSQGTPATGSQGTPATSPAAPAAAPAAAPQTPVTPDGTETVVPGAAATTTTAPPRA